jgi:hypothetical protein
MVLAAWPSGLRRQFQVLVSNGAGSNPAAVNSFLATLFAEWVPSLVQSSTLNS